MARNSFIKSSDSNDKSKKSSSSSKSTARKKKVKKPSPKLEAIKTFTNDERVQKISGIFIVFISVFILLSCLSYIVTGNDDLRLILASDEVAEQRGIETFRNLMGKAGAYTAWFFMNQYFGIAAILIPFILFLTGIRIWLKKTLLPFGKTIRFTLLGLFYIPLLIGFFGHDRIEGLDHTIEIVCNANLVGGYGHAATVWTTFTLGIIGTFLLLVFILGAVIVFNLSAPLAWIQEKLSPLFSRKEKKEEQEESEDEKTEMSNKVIEDIYDDLIEKDDSEEEDNTDDVLDEIIGSNVEFDTDSKEAVKKKEEPSDNNELEIENEDKIAEPEEDKSEKLEIEVAEKEAEAVVSEDDMDDLVKEFGEYDPKLDLSRYELPSIDLLKQYGGSDLSVNRDELEVNKNKIVETLNNYKIEISKIRATIGPTVTLYEIIPAPGVRISKIKNLEDDIALSLAALGIRIIAPIPGRGTIGIEVPNSNPDIVSMHSLIASEKFQNSDMELPVALGKTISNETYVADLAKMPHLLMAGATGQGKSVGLNAILVSLLYKKHPAQIKFVLVDPKKVELTLFNKIERHFLAKLPGEEEAIITDTHKVVQTLSSLCTEMDTRYDLLKQAQVRNLKEYNTKFIKRKLNPENGHRYLPYIVLVVDEFADLIMTAGKEVETPIARLAQLARAIGIHLIIATQRPSVNIITGTIKANFPARAAFRVTAKIDSRTILDAGGADQLIGRGDMLYSTGNEVVRLQCGFVDTPEVEAICEFIGSQKAYPSAFLLPEFIDEKASDLGNIADEDRDSLFEDAASIVVMHQQGSASLLQRKLKLGYNRAGRIVDQLESAGIIGPFKGSKAREVLIPDEIALEQLLKSMQEQSNFN